MTPRRLSRGAAVVLMTTALAWNLPAAAQIAPASDGGATAVTSKPEAARASVPPAAAAGQPGPGERARGGTFGGGRAASAAADPVAPAPTPPASGPATGADVPPPPAIHAPGKS
ncbi:MAG TPA: hypothetical protein PKN51_04330 [Ottowia sp.]|nr:hypothetical protein [Ottowia sp.]